MVIFYYSLNLVSSVILMQIDYERWFGGFDLKGNYQAGPGVLVVYLYGLIQVFARDKGYILMAFRLVSASIPKNKIIRTGKNS
tara:strand:+ start:1385 stop:1633 length:249 start_codon:yes stop_codon:yes gene_type:complete